MKLSKIALSLIALVGVAGIGGSYFTGKQVEQRYPEIIAQINQQLKQQNNAFIQMEFKDVQIERHFFSSDTQYVLNITINGENYPLQGRDTIYHGPFPINRLTKANLLPVAVSIDSQLNLPDELKKAFNAPQFWTTQSDLNYAGNFSSHFKIEPLKNDIFETEAIQGDYDGDLFGKGKGSLLIPKLNFLDDNGTTFEAKNVRYQANSVEDHGLSRLGLGTVSLQADSLKMTNLERNKHFAYQNMVFDVKNTLKGERYEGDLNLSSDLAIGDGKETFNLGKFSGNFMIESDAKLTNDISVYTSDPKMFSSPQAVEIWQNLAKKGFKIHLNPLKLTKESGELELQLVLNSKPTDTLIHDPYELLTLLQKSHLKLKLDLATLQELIHQFSLGEGLDEQQAKQQAEQIIAQIKHQFNQPDIKMIDDKAITIDLGVDEGKIHLNGQALSENGLQNTLLRLLF